MALSAVRFGIRLVPKKGFSDEEDGGYAEKDKSLWGAAGCFLVEKVSWIVPVLLVLLLSHLSR